MREPDPSASTSASRVLFARRVAAAQAALRDCRSCPRDCGVDRWVDERGVCQTGRHPLVASAFPHHGEEDCLSGRRGSGTIFFAGCGLRCVFCQNADISQAAEGDEMAPEMLAELMLALQDSGCHNINLVTPGHVVPQIVEALVLALPAGLTVPVVYNTGGYDTASSLQMLEGLVDIYMPDFKLWTEASAKRLLDAPDYPDVARAALREMHRQVGDLLLGADGIATRGLLVRHLVLPGLVAESTAIFRWLARELSRDTWVNVMGQYRPEACVGVPDGSGKPRYTDLDRRLSGYELDLARAEARAAGLHRFEGLDQYPIFRS